VVRIPKRFLFHRRLPKANEIFRWESSADRAGEQSLIRNVVGTLGKMDSTPNCLEYPQSKYDNLRNGFQG
jgi:hypothetical protein